MNARIAVGPSRGPRTLLEEVSPGRVRIVLDAQMTGPVMTRRAAKVVARWLNEGGLADLEGGDKVPKLQRVLSEVDRAADSVLDLLKNGLR
jgi:hypothetical protein